MFARYGDIKKRKNLNIAAKMIGINPRKYKKKQENVQKSQGKQIESKREIYRKYKGNIQKTYRKVKGKYIESTKNIYRKYKENLKTFIYRDNIQKIYTTYIYNI